MQQPPVINIKRCSDCGSCLEVAPEIFGRDPETGVVHVLERDDYPLESLEAAVNICPEDCIDIDK